MTWVRVPVCFNYGRETPVKLYGDPEIHACHRVSQHYSCQLIIDATSNSNMWPLTRKRSLRFAVFASIVARMPCISRSNGSGYPCKEKLYPFERLRLSVQRKFASVWMARAIRAKKIRIRSNGWGYPCEKICHPSERLWLSVQKKCVQR